jgi:hypothetical protein
MVVQSTSRAKIGAGVAEGAFGAERGRAVLAAGVLSYGIPERVGRHPALRRASTNRHQWAKANWCVRNRTYAVSI